MNQRLSSWGAASSVAGFISNCGKDWVSHSVLLCYQIKPTQAVCSAVLEQLFISLLHSAWTLFWYCHHPRRWTHPSCLWHPKPITRLISFDCSLFDRSTDSSTTSSSSSIHIHPFVVQSPLRTSSSTSRALGDVYSHRPWWVMASHGESLAHFALSSWLGEVGLVKLYHM